MFYCFFFQAEDGIRDAQESRGLGDVYKRQALISVSDKKNLKNLLKVLSRYKIELISSGGTFKAVSYTHLTLPTNREV